MHLISETYLPIFNESDLQTIFGDAPLPFDDQNLFCPLELLALPSAPLQIRRELDSHIAEVTVGGYPSEIPLFTDLRLGEVHPGEAPKWCPKLPPKEVILERMLKGVGLPYIWGGNAQAGVPAWRELYAPKRRLSPLEDTIWSLKGVDCSGLLYEAADGALPRNTTELMQVGEEIPLDSEVRPLDLFVWPGHILIAISPTEVIESSHKKRGVVISPLKERLNYFAQQQESISQRRFAF